MISLCLVLFSDGVSLCTFYDDLHNYIRYYYYVLHIICLYVRLTVF